MGAITEIFRSYGPQFLETQPGLTKEQKKVIKAIINCRSGSYGVTIYRCPQCRKTHIFDRSCGNRHCPQCQYLKSRRWLETQVQRKLPTPYFMLTFTVPAEIRAFCLSFQKQAYGAMFKAAADATRLLAKDPHYIGAETIGLTGVLHTWGRQMQYHPHIHFIVPAGGLSKSGNTWLPSHNLFYLPVKALSRIYRALFKAEMAKLGLLRQITSSVWSCSWNVNCQPVGDGEPSLKYLAPYVFRVAISDSRIISVEGQKVTFAYRKTGSNRLRTSSIHVFEFIRRFLLHVLPSGFMNVRHYGFMSAATGISLVKLRLLILRVRKLSCMTFDQLLSPRVERHSHIASCRGCGSQLKFICSIIPGVPFRGPT